MVKFVRIKAYIEAFQFDGDLKNQDGEWYVPDWAVEAFENGVLYFASVNAEPCELFVKTVECDVHVSVGDYIVRGIHGELYSCNEDIFNAVYRQMMKEGE